MATYEIKTSAGTYQVETEDGGGESKALNPPMYNMQEGSPLSLTERAKVSLAKGPENRLETMNRMGIEGASLNDKQQPMVGDQLVSPPVDGLGSAIANLPGMVADNFGGAITLAGQAGAGIAALPAAAAAGPAGIPLEMAAAAAGGGAADVARQGLLNMAAPGTGYDAGQTAGEAGLAAVGPPLGYAGAKLLKPIAAPVGAILSQGMKKWGEAFPKVLEIQTGLKAEMTKHYMERKLIDGVDISSGKYGASTTADIASRTLFGLPNGAAMPPLEGDRAKLLASQIEKLGPGAVDLMERYAGLSPETSEYIIQRGARNITKAEKLDPAYVNQLALRVQNGLDSALKEAGENVGAARQKLISGQVVSPTAATDITAPNEALAQYLQNKQVLTQIPTPDGPAYVMNRGYAKQGVGRHQQSFFKGLMEDFFKKVEVPGSSTMGGAELAAKMKGRSGKEVEALLKQAARNEAPVTAYVPKNTMKFQDFINELSKWESQIGDKTFENLDELSPALAEYVRADKATGLRNIVLSKAEAAGDTSLAFANQRHTMLRNLSDGLASDNKSAGSAQAVENFFRSVTSKDPNMTNVYRADDIERELASKGQSFLADLKDYMAAKELKKVDGMSTINKFQNELDSIYQNGSEHVNQYLEAAESKVAPKLRFLRDTKDSLTHESFQRSSPNMFRAAFAGRLTAPPGGSGPINAISNLLRGIGVTAPNIAGKLEARIATSLPAQMASQGMQAAGNTAPNLVENGIASPIGRTLALAALTDMANKKPEKRR